MFILTFITCSATITRIGQIRVSNTKVLGTPSPRKTSSANNEPLLTIPYIRNQIPKKNRKNYQEQLQTIYKTVMNYSPV